MAETRTSKSVAMPYVRNPQKTAGELWKQMYEKTEEG